LAVEIAGIYPDSQHNTTRKLINKFLVDLEPRDMTTQLIEILSTFLGFQIFLCIVFQVDWCDADATLFVSSTCFKKMSCLSLTFCFPQTDLILSAPIPMVSESFKWWIQLKFGVKIKSLIPSEDIRQFMLNVASQTLTLMRLFRLNYNTDVNQKQTDPLLEHIKGSIIDSQISILTESLLSCV